MDLLAYTVENGDYVSEPDDEFVADLKKLINSIKEYDNFWQKKNFYIFYYL